MTRVLSLRPRFVLLRRLIAFIGETVELAVQTLVQAVKPPYRYQLIETVNQMYIIGVQSVSITVVTAVFTGGVLALQTAYGLSRFGGTEFVPYVVSLSLVRELGPVLTALIVGGRVGSGMTAEVGSMQVTEQVDAIRALGANPVKKLVVPRVLACMLMFPLLTAIANVLGIISGMYVSELELELSRFDYLSEVQRVVRVIDFMSGSGKALVFGFTIGIVGCFYGFRTRGGTEGVGLSTTRTVVTCALLVLISDYFITKLFIVLFPFAK